VPLPADTVPCVNDLEVALAAARAGARIVAEGFRSGASTDWKGEVDPVTEVDRSAEAAIVSAIREARPDDGILAEEGSDTETASGRRWVIDPLDGTVNFVQGIPHVAVSVALEDAAGSLVGVIVDPLRSEEFTSTRGGGAFLNGRPISVSTCADISEAVVSTGFGYDRREHGPAYTETVGAVLRVARGVRRMGSAAVDLAWVACGRLDGHWEFTLAPWDIAAGVLLISEAGGTLSNSRGGPSDPADLVATNGRFHEALRSVVAAHRPAHVPEPGA